MTLIPNETGPAPRHTDSARGVAAGLRRFAVPATPRPHDGGPPERCDLCGEQLTVTHPHMVDPQHRSIACACTACALLFTRPGGRYRTIGDRVRYDPRAPLTDAEWAQLSIPVAVAFFFVNSALGRVVASYPSPVGATECELDLAAWDRLARTHPLLGALTGDIEAILVVRRPAAEMFLLPIDMCYWLVGALRLNWHGFDGGAEVERILLEFLAGLRQRARALEA